MRPVCASMSALNGSMITWTIKGGISRKRLFTKPMRIISLFALPLSSAAALPAAKPVSKDAQTPSAARRNTFVNIDVLLCSWSSVGREGMGSERRMTLGEAVRRRGRAASHHL